MATTRRLTHRLTSAWDVWITTYFGGTRRGTCFDISMKLGNGEVVSATFTKRDLEEALRRQNSTTNEGGNMAGPRASGI